MKTLIPKFRRFALTLLAVAGLTSTARAVVEIDSSTNFAAASSGYAVPTTAQNLLAAAGTTLVAVPVNPAVEPAPRPTASSWATLTDGAFGTVPATGGGGLSEVKVATGNLLTYTFATAQNITVIDVYSGWGDNGRMQQRYTVSYATTAAPTTFVTIKAVAYNPAGVNSAWVRLTDLGISNVKSLRFNFAVTQQNGYVGMTEISAQSTATAVDQGYVNNFAAGSAGYQPLVNLTAPSNLLAAAGTTLAVSGGAPATPLDGTGAPAAWSKLVDGSYGTVPPGGGGGANSVQINNGYILTYTFASPQSIGYLDLYTSWGDNGRMWHDYTIHYATSADPGTFVAVKTVSYRPSANSAWVHLIAAGMTDVSSVRFAFGTQQNGMVGFAELVAVPPSPAAPPPGAFTKTEVSNTFATGSAGYQANVPPAGSNLLAAAGTVLTLTPGTPAAPPDGGGGTTTNWAALTDGSYGLVPPSGGGGPGEVAISSTWTLTYSLAAPSDVAGLDVFTGWGDTGRMWPDVNVSYTTVASGYTYITIPPIAYHPSANSAWVHLDFNPAYSQVTSIRFSFPAQQNGYVGYNELSAVAPRPDTDHDNLADDWEMAKAGNLTDLTGLLSGPGPGADTGNFDGDTLTDLQEFNLSYAYPNLNPKSADSDTDGLEDGAEIAGSPPRPPTNPTNADSDGDGLTDSVESNSGTFAGAGNPGSNPTIADTDGDQYPDGYEAQRGGNPVDNTILPTTLPPGILLGVVTDEVSTGISTTKTYTHKISGGGAATVNSVDLDPLTDTLTPANFVWATAGGKNNYAFNPPASYGTWNPSLGNVTGAGNLTFFGGFVYSGGSGAVGGSQTYTLSNLQPGLTYELRLFIRKWDDGTVRPATLKFINGTTATNYYVLEDRPGTVLGNGNDNSAYYISFTYVAEGTSLVVQTTVPNVTSASGSYHMYGLTNNESGPPPPLDFVSVVRAPDGSSTTLTISSRPGRTYAVDFSTNLVNWLELTDNVPATGTATVYVDTEVSNLRRVFYQVRDVTP